MEQTFICGAARLEILGPNQRPDEIDEQQAGHSAADGKIQHQIRSQSSA
jgi:hypothetical protein